jgi:Raf kinase inhibitor-like YbhB/YbcL family protein
VANIPGDISDLPENAGDPANGFLPSGAFQLPNDARMARYVGGAPPPGHGEHRYFVTVHALDVDDIGVPADGTPAFLGFTMSSHVLARASLLATADTPAA